MALPLVSVIVPYYSHGRHLHQAVLSAMRAYSGPLEVLLVNDGSVEAKAAHYLEAACALSPAVRVIEQSNQGLSGARNTGIANAAGEFVQLLDSDDMLTPGKIDMQIDHFRIRPELSVALSNYLICDQSASHFQRDGDPMTRFDFTLRDFLFHWERGFSIPIHTALFRRSALDPGSFEKALKGKEDWLFWSRLAASGHVMSYAPVYGAVYRQHLTSMSKSFKQMGESWFAAARMVEEVVPQHERQAFRTACEEWHENFYAPRIREEATAPAVAGVAAELPAEQGAHEAPLSAAPPCMSAKVKAGRGFSVLIPVYNHYRYLRSCLQSILSQTARNPVEVIVVDDASSDERVAPLLEAFARVSSNIIVLRNETNLGIAETQNRAAAAASGEFLAFVDCDDALPVNALAGVEEALASDTDYLFTDRADIDANDKRIRIATYGGYRHIKPSGDVAADLLDGMVASHLKVIRRRAFLDAGGFDAAFGGVQDWELALKMARAGARFQYLPRVLYLHRLHEGSVTGADSVRQFWLSNLVRRRFAVAALRPLLGDEEARRRARDSLAEASRPGVQLFQELDRIGIERIKRAWRAGKVCAYRIGKDASIEEINALREYNSYFDTVFAPDEASACALVGYMWDHDALVLEGEGE